MIREMKCSILAAVFPIVWEGLAPFEQSLAADPDLAWKQIGPFFRPPPEFAGDFGPFKSPLRFHDGRPVKSAADWAERREEILRYWHKVMGPWPSLIEKPKIEYLTTTHRENFAQHRVRVEIAPGQTAEGYLLIPAGQRPFPAVFVPYYEPETSVGLSTNKLRDFSYQLAKRGFVTLSIGSPGGDARKPATDQANCQPLSFLACVAAPLLQRARVAAGGGPQAHWHRRPFLWRQMGDVRGLPLRQVRLRRLV